MSDDQPKGPLGMYGRRISAQNEDWIKERQSEKEKDSRESKLNTKQVSRAQREQVIERLFGKAKKEQERRRDEDEKEAAAKKDPSLRAREKCWGSGNQQHSPPPANTEKSPKREQSYSVRSHASTRSEILHLNTLLSQDKSWIDEEQRRHEYLFYPCRPNITKARKSTGEVTRESTSSVLHHHSSKTSPQREHHRSSYTDRGGSASCDRTDRSRSASRERPPDAAASRETRSRSKDAAAPAPAPAPVAAPTSPDFTAGFDPPPASRRRSSPNIVVQEPTMEGDDASDAAEDGATAAAEDTSTAIAASPPAPFELSPEVRAADGSEPRMTPQSSTIKNLPDPVDVPSEELVNPFGIPATVSGPKPVDPYLGKEEDSEGDLDSDEAMDRLMRKARAALSE
eukprot:Rhum_TRINITY_DN13586_c1_g1::Rhum_TRINITY_DN13586_c1_g1_i1::g.61557::m.61557